MKSTNIYLVALLVLFLSSCNKPFNVEELKKVEVGYQKEEVLSKVGEPSKLKEISRWKYKSDNQVYIFKGKIDNYFLSVDSLDDSKITRRKSETYHNPFLDIRIGMSKEELIEIVGEPESKEDIEFIYYKDHQQIVLSQGKVESVDLHSFQDLSILDKIRLNFNGGSMFIINISLAIIMFGVALDIKLEHFREVIKNPKAIILGVSSQFFVLPALTFVLIMIIQPTTSVAMGMILVAACPGGNISNFMTSMAKGNSALSISLTAIATLAAIFMTPLNFSFWGNLYAESSELIVPIEIDAYQMVKTVMILLGIPVVLGLLFRKFFEKLAIRIVKPMRIFSLVFFVGLVIGAMSLNFEFIIDYLHLVALMVFVHNLLALGTGYSIATIFKLKKEDRKTLTIETGIQNSGLALVLIFNPKLFDGIGGMAFIAAWWGIWHIISGLTVAGIWNKVDKRAS